MKDKLGMPVDKGIRELVIALRMFGVRTIMSCGGHARARRGSRYPWVMVDSTDAALLCMLAARQNAPMRRQRKGKSIRNYNNWMIVPLGSTLHLCPFERKRTLKEMRYDADEFAAHLRDMADSKS